VIAVAQIVASSDDARMSRSDPLVPTNLDSERFRRNLIERVRSTVGAAHMRGDRSATGLHPRVASIEMVREAARRLSRSSRDRRLVAA
jgi:hypothetical protein